MTRYNFVICDHEFMYAKSLAEYITTKRELSFLVLAFSDIQHVENFAKAEEVFIFLVGECNTYEQRCCIKAENVFVLTEGKCMDLGYEENSIYKYQSADKILNKILEICINNGGENVLLRTNMQEVDLIGVYSPIGRIGKTTFAIGKGKELSKKKKVLYLNLEGYAGGQFAKDEQVHTLTDLLYYAKQEQGNIGIRLQSMTSQIDELDYIAPMPICEDLKSVTLKEWQQLLTEIMNKSIYEVIILDIGESVQGIFSLLRMCHTVFMPVFDDFVSSGKLLQYIENANLLGYEDVLTNTIQISLGREG